MNRVCEMLGIKYPIFQGAMAWIAEERLASAVSEAGGFGIIAAGNAPPDIVRDQVRKAKKLTDKPIGLNIMLLSPYTGEIARIACEEGVAAVATGAGSPDRYMEMFKNNGIKVIPVVPSVAHARRMQKLGADAVVAEGMESGGHIGKLTTMALVPQVVDAVDIPVIGAGGVGDGRGVLAVFALGAEGVQIGTRFLVAKECIVHQNFKNAVLKAKDIDTVVTGQLTGHPVRVLKNKLARRFEALEKEESAKPVPDLAQFDALGTGALKRAVIEGDMENGSVMCGQVAGMVCKEQTCAEIIRELLEEYRQAYERIGGAV